MQFYCGVLNKSLLLFILLLIGRNYAHGQTCIATFPYNESFETTDGNWASGGTSPDWAWGQPSKPVINGAANGNRCWVTGGLNNVAYNNSESSWLQSPCFDFTSLKYPHISFAIFWETEKQYDGALFQYSTNGGGTWNTLGNTNSNNNCQGENWYNAPSVKYLGNDFGWSGNIQPNNGSCVGGGGSRGWLTAKHTLSMLAGKNNVMFRFLFGSGSTCNAFDGFAIDDIQIGEALPKTASINSECVADKAVSFKAVAACSSSYTWNFGDPGSGTSNISTDATPVHIFSSPGTYNVTLTAGFTTGPPAITNTQVTVIGVSQKIDWPGRCVDIYDGKFSVIATGSNNPYSYVWDTRPVQTSDAVINLTPGNYTVKVSAAGACDGSTTFVVRDSQMLRLSVDIKNASCVGKDGSITTIVTGGLPPYSYIWSNGSKQANLMTVDSGYYHVQIDDANNCGLATSDMLVDIDRFALPVNLGDDIGLCPGEQVILNAGNFSSYLWQDGSTKQDYHVVSPGLYYVQVDNGHGCLGMDSLLVSLDCSKIYFPSAFSPNNDGINESFGPLGNISAIKDYTFSVYNRYGQSLFTTSDPFRKWDGRSKGYKLNTGAYVWIAAYRFRGRQTFTKGLVTLIN